MDLTFEEVKRDAGVVTAAKLRERGTGEEEHSWETRWRNCTCVS